MTDLSHSDLSSSMSEEGQKTAEEGQKTASRVKRCFAELRSLLPKSGDQAGSTLATLQTVIHHFKKIKDETEELPSLLRPTEFFESNIMNLQASEGLDTQILSSDDDPVCVDSKFEQGDYRMVVSTSGHVIEEVSQNLRQYLGYAKMDMHKLPIQKFIFEKDLVTFNSHMSSLKVPGSAAQDQSFAQPSQKVNFFLRIWHNPPLKSRFSVFYISAFVTVSTTTAAGQSQQQTFSQSSIAGKQEVMASWSWNTSQAGSGDMTGSGSSGVKGQGFQFVLECSRLQSSYKSRNQVLDQLSSSFHFKHTPQGQVSFLHPYGIPLTGYLPQDMIGQPFLGFYPPDELPQLLELYEEVVKNPGKTVASPILKFKAKNNEFLVIKSEMSCFINPWSKKVDFVIGQMSVVRGPQNLDVFGEYGQRKVLVESVTEQDLRQQIEAKIRGVLGKVPSANVDSGYGGLKDRDTNVVPSGNNGKNSDSSPSAEFDNSEGVPSSLDISQWDEQEVAKIYNSVAYLQGIQRLLASRAVEPSSHGWPQEWGREGSSDSDVASRVRDRVDNVSLHGTSAYGEIEEDFPRPPSCNSSTKAMVWEEDHDLQPSSNPPSPMSQEEVPSMSVASLTLKNLEEHQKNMRHVYLESILRDRDMKLLHESISARKLICSLHNRMRRRHLKRPADSLPSEDYQPGKQAKYEHKDPKPAGPTGLSGDPLGLRDQPFRITSLDMPGSSTLLHMDQASRPEPQVSHVLQPFSCLPSHRFTSTLTQASSSRPGLINPSHPVFVPFSRTLTQSRPPGAFASPQKGMHPVTSVYQAIPNLQDMLDAVSSTRSTSLDQSKSMAQHLPSLHMAAAAVQHKAESLASDMESSTHYSLVQTTTEPANLSDSEDACSELDARQHHHTLPFWMEHIHMSHDKAMNYQVNLDPSRELALFREALCKEHQPDEVFRQVTEYELGKVDLDMEEDSDTSSLFMPWRASEVARKWAENGPPRKAAVTSSTHSTDTDERITADYRPYRPARAPRKSLSHLLNVVMSDSTEISTGPLAAGGGEQVMDDMAQDDGKEDESGSDTSGNISGMSKNTGSNQGSTNSSAAASKTDSANTQPSKDGSCKGSMSSGGKTSLSGYMASVEQTSSVGDSSMEDGFSPLEAYLYSNRIFRKTYGDYALLMYKSELSNSGYILDAARQTVQTDAITEQLTELLGEISTDMKPQSEEGWTSEINAPPSMLKTFMRSSGKDGNGNSTTGDSGFQSGTMSRADSYSTAASKEAGSSSLGSGQDSNGQDTKNSSASTQSSGHSNGSGSDNGSSGKEAQAGSGTIAENQTEERNEAQSVDSEDSGNVESNVSQVGWTSNRNQKQRKQDKNVKWDILSDGDDERQAESQGRTQPKRSLMFEDDNTERRLCEWFAEDKLLQLLFRAPCMDDPYLSPI